jgi:hypothetical protein
MKYLIVAADRIIDGQGNHSKTDNLFARAQKSGVVSTELYIVSQAKRWEDKLGPNQFKSGASAMAAISKAQKLIASKKSSIVMIKGVDHLRTGYSRDEREKFMKLYEKKSTPLDGYSKLVDPFIKHHKISKKQFAQIRDALFENYTKTWKALDSTNKLPDAKWFQLITKYFRGVDCANPNIDYSGQLIITDEKHADLLKIPKKERVEILGNAFSKLSIDGMASIPRIAPYAHLKRTLNKALIDSEVDFKTEFLKGNALLEAYTCYPVVPMALVLKLGLVQHLSEMPAFLKHHQVTITGGLNLVRAPWNLTSLNYLIAMRDKLLSSKKQQYGLVHGNGSLGNQQGITILAASVSEN